MSLTILGGGVSFTKTTFPGGESCIRVTSDTFPSQVTILLAFESNADLFDLALLVDAIRRFYMDNLQDEPSLELVMPYVPYARQDRVCNKGESLSVKVVADFINGLGLSYVCVIDPHSDVTAAVFNDLLVVPQERAAHRVAAVMNVENTIIVAPDAGASKKARKFATEGRFGGLVQAEKVRDLMTGKILETTVRSSYPTNVDYLIVDDICDGGRTFIELAKVLRTKTTGKIMLFVTHGIFSAGEEVFDGLIDELYTSNPVGATGKAAVASGRVIQL